MLEEKHVFGHVHTDEMNKLHNAIIATYCNTRLVLQYEGFHCCAWRRHVTHNPLCDSELLTCAPSFAHTTSLPRTSLLSLECCCATVAVCLTSAHLVGGALMNSSCVHSVNNQPQQLQGPSWSSIYRCAGHCRSRASESPSVCVPPEGAVAVLSTRASEGAVAVLSTRACHTALSICGGIVEQQPWPSVHRPASCTRHSLSQPLPYCSL
jgi:hypothetical protein